jgi:YesN/AraC family two-component response regulator
MGRAGSILVVDDDPGIQEALASVLASRYQVSKAATATTAIDAICSEHFDLILLDYYLPDLLGTDVLGLIKRYFPSTMVILITGFGSEEIAIQALRGGARDYIRKPIDLRDLQARVDSLMALRHHGSERRHSTYVQLSDAIYPRGLPEQDPQGADRRRAILKAIRHIDEHMDDALSLAAVARAAGMSKYHFCRQFKVCTGLYFREYLARRRIARAKELLKDESRTITGVFRDVGFKDMTHFGRVFRRIEGQLPSEFRRKTGTDGQSGAAIAAQEGQAIQRA